MGGLKWRLCYKKSRVLARARMPPPLCSLFEGVTIPNISAKTRTRNQACGVSQCQVLFCSTALMFRATVRMVLHDRVNHFDIFTFSPRFCSAQSAVSMGCICNSSEPHPGTFDFDILLCWGQCTPSDCQEVLWSFLFQSFFLESSAHKTQIQKLNTEQVCGWTPWKISLLTQSLLISYWRCSVGKGWNPGGGQVHLLCLNYFFAFAHVLKRSASRKADPQERVAQTCHRLLYYQVQVFVVQEDCYLLGRSRRGQALKEEDFLGCKESGVLGGGRPLLKLLFCSFSWQVGWRYHESGHTWSRLGIPSPYLCYWWRKANHCRSQLEVLHLTMLPVEYFRNQGSMLRRGQHRIQ